jgi:hypothetical protein
MKIRLSWLVIWLLGWLLLSGLGCQSDQPREAPGVPAEQMRSVLRDLQIVDAWVDRQGGPFDRRKQMRDEMYDQVLTQHELDRETFHQAYQFYLDYPAELDTLYSHIKRDMQAELDSVRKQHDDEVKGKLKQKEADPRPSIKERLQQARDDDA